MDQLKKSNILNTLDALAAYGTRAGDDLKGCPVFHISKGVKETERGVSVFFRILAYPMRGDEVQLNEDPFAVTMVRGNEMKLMGCDDDFRYNDAKKTLNVNGKEYRLLVELTGVGHHKNKGRDNCTYEIESRNHALMNAEHNISNSKRKTGPSMTSRAKQ